MRTSAAVCICQINGGFVYRAGIMSSSTQHVQALRLGSLTLQPVSDGAILQMDPSSIFRDARPEEWQPHVSLNDRGHLELALTCLLVQVGDRQILVDTGYGAQPERPEVGQLANSLAKVGVLAGDIDTVVISHPHGDHIGGATVGSGEAVRLMYPSARYWLGQADWEHFSTPDMLQQPGLVDKLQPLAKAKRLDLAAGEQEIAPGVRLLPLPGHTPGHMGVAFTAGQEMAIYVGDLVHHSLQIEHPEWSPIFDSLPPLSRETRRDLVERARREHALVLSYHLPFPGIGHIGGTGWEPVARAD
jgi:glyoxylase-like metal-dependent hydrolase (beta-lactamase superfamily II)